MILKMEMSQASIKNSSVEIKTKLTNDLIRLLQVREKNEAMSKDWLLFLATSKFQNLRPGEVYEAFKMAMGRELLDQNGKEFDLFPELSNNTTGKVLSAYQIWKNENSTYHLAKSNLKALANKREMSDEEKKQVREEFLEMVYNELIDDGFSDSAWLLYDDIKSKLTVSIEVQKRLYAIQKIKNRYVKFTDYRSLTAVRNVKNVCRSIVACNYLKNHLGSINEFKNAINERRTTRQRNSGGRTPERDDHGKLQENI